MHFANCNLSHTKEIKALKKTVLLLSYSVNYLNVTLVF